MHRQCCCFPWSKNIRCIHRRHRILSSPISEWTEFLHVTWVPFAVRLIGFLSIIMKYKCSFFRSQLSLPDLHTILFYTLAALAAQHHPIALSLSQFFALFCFYMGTIANNLPSNAAMSIRSELECAYKTTINIAHCLRELFVYAMQEISLHYKLIDLKTFVSFSFKNRGP